MAATHTPSLAILRRKHVEQRTGLSRSTIYDKLSSSSPRFDPLFPKAIQLGANSVGWIESEIDEWINGRIHFTRLNE